MDRKRAARGVGSCYNAHCRRDSFHRRDLTPKGNSMLGPPQFGPGARQDKQFEDWIDRVITEGQAIREVAAGIASVTQPGGLAGYEVSPELLGNEGWFWPW